MFELFKRKKKTTAAVGDKLEETLNAQRQNVADPHQSFLTLQDQPDTPTLSDFEAAETKSMGGLPTAAETRKFINMSEVVNTSVASRATGIGSFFSAGFGGLLGNKAKQNGATKPGADGLQRALSLESFGEYKAKIGKITILLKQEQDKVQKDREQWERTFGDSRHFRNQGTGKLNNLFLQNTLVQALPKT